MSCDMECMNELRIKRLEEDCERNQQTHKEFFKRFEDVNISMAMFGKDISSLVSKLDEISADVKEIKDKPAKRYETVIYCALTTFVGAVIGFILSGVMPI